MNSLSFTSSLLCPPTYQQYRFLRRLSTLRTNCPLLYSHTTYYIHTTTRFHPLKTRHSLACVKNQPDEGPVAVVDFEDLNEKDWSFLGAGSIKSKEEHDRKVDQIICAGNVVDSSKILVSMGSEDFVDRLIGSSPSQLLLVVHESFLSLACIKEMHDEVKCWQGGFISVPKKWASFDVVFLYYLPAFPLKLENTFKALASRCAPGAKVVISHLQGRKGLEQEKQNYPGNVVSDLPKQSALEKVASKFSFVIKDYIDDQDFYLAVLEFKS